MVTVDSLGITGYRPVSNAVTNSCNPDDLPSAPSAATTPVSDEPQSMNLARDFGPFVARAILTNQGSPVVGSLDRRLAGRYPATETRRHFGICGYESNRHVAPYRISSKSLGHDCRGRRSNRRWCGYRCGRAWLRSAAARAERLR